MTQPSCTKRSSRTNTTDSTNGRNGNRNSSSPRSDRKSSVSSRKMSISTNANTITNLNPSIQDWSNSINRVMKGDMPAPKERLRVLKTAYFEGNVVFSKQVPIRNVYLFDDCIAVVNGPTDAGMNGDNMNW